MGRIDSSGRGVFGKHGAKAEFVYFVQGEQLRLIKIGIARDLNNRLKGLQTGSPDKLTLLGVIMPKTRTPLQLEDQLHARFADDRSHGEWFRPSAALLAYIDRHAKSLSEIQEQLAAEAMAKWEAHDQRPKAPPDAPAGPSGNGRKARMARYLAARGLTA